MMGVIIKSCGRGVLLEIGKRGGAGEGIYKKGKSPVLISSDAHLAPSLEMTEKHGNRASTSSNIMQ